MTASISMSFLTVCSPEGCVENEFENELPEFDGIMKNAFMPSIYLRSCVGIRVIVPFIFKRALASLLGLPVIRAPSLSASNSR